MGLSKALSGSSKDYSSVNPDPKKFTLIHVATNDRYTYAIVQYPNCTNYLGIKFLVYEGDITKELQEADSIDPHFLDRESPIARFHPEKNGTMMNLFGFELQYKTIRVFKQHDGPVRPLGLANYRDILI